MVQYWDPWIRLFHWSLVFIVLYNHFWNDSGDDWHEWLGYFACVLVGWRIIWGFFGSIPARFSDLKKQWPPRREFFKHLVRFFRGRERRYINHPPIAQIGFASMIFCILALAFTGWMMSWDRYFGEDWVEEVHGAFSTALIALAAVHVLGVLWESFMQRENLVSAMIHGKKRP